MGLLTGCMFEEESIETEDDNLVHMVFTAMVEDGNPATRTVLDENEADGFRGVLWEPEDVIGIATYNGRYQRFENVLEEPAASGVFEGSVNQDIMYYAIYPYRDNQQMGSSVNVAIPSKQTYQPDSFDGSAAPMVGKGNHAEPLHFMNLCGSLAINITGTEKIKSILFQTKAGEKVSGDATVDPDYADYPVMTMGEATDDYIVLDCGEGVQLSGTPTSFHFVLPPATYNGFDLLITTTDGQFMQKSTDKQLTIKRSIITKAASFAFENTTGTFVNLSERGNANCYIVPQSGYYSFDGTVIGNGEFGFTPENNFHTNTHEISPVTAELLWADNHTLIKGCGYDASTGMVKFLTSGEEGNAVIAVKDSEGNILWSWHIWMTDQPEEQVYFNNAGTMMDRNLGAISATPGDVGALGLLYQWGRKDPFLGSSSVFYAAQPPSTIDWPAAVGADYETGTIDYSVQHPTTFISQGQYNNDWLYTGSSNVDYSRWQSQKTIYDPCPAGWRVPDGGPDGVWAKAGIVFDGSYDSSYCGITFENNGLSLWYPSAGDRAFSSGALQSQNSYGNYWSVTPEGSGVYRFSFNSSGMQNTNSDNYPAWGFSVRCFKEGSGSGSGSTAPDIEDGTIDGPYKVTLAQFLNMSESSDIWYELTGEIINIENRDYGNFTIKDATGQVYIYGLTAQWSSSNDKSFSQLGLELGDIVTLGSIRTSYSGEPQGGGPAFYISHVAGTGPDEPEQTGPFDSNVSWQIVDSSYEDATSVINGQADVKTLKLGTSSRPGSATVTLPAGASSLSFYGVAWARRTGNLVINDASGNEIRTFSFASNDGATGNPPYTITVTDTDHYEIDLSTFTSSPLPSDLTLTFSTTADATRVILWGIQAK